MIIMTLLAIIIFASMFWNISLKKIHFEYWMVALAALLIAIILGAIQPQLISQTMLGDSAIQPWKVILTFFCIAYMAISLDSTGILEFASYKVTRIAKTNSRLFFYVFLLSGLVTIIVNNDIAILTLTPSVIYFGRHTKTDIIPLLFAEFFAANIFSMIFFTGDPTNIVLASAMNYSFLSFAKLMIIPTLFSAVTAFIIMRLVFKKSLKDNIKLAATNQLIVTNWPIAIFSLVLLAAMILALMLSDSLGLPIWQIVLIFSAITLMKDLLTKKTNINHSCRLVHNLAKIPWKILPLIIFFFIFVDMLSKTDAFEQTADIISQLTSKGNLIAALGSTSSLMANLFNNQPVTIFMTKLATKVSISINSGLYYTPLAIVIATSVGATLTTIGTLAGIMWQSILHQHDIKMTYLQYLKTSVKITPFALAAGLIGLFISISIFGN